MELVRCTACWGRKVVNGMGGQLRDCSACKATGYIEKVAPKSNVETIDTSAKPVEKIEEHQQIASQLDQVTPQTIVEQAVTEAVPEVKLTTVEAVPEVVPKKKEETKPKDRRQIAIEKGKLWNLTEQMVDAILEEPNMEVMAWRRKYAAILADELAAPAYRATLTNVLPDRSARKSFRESLASEFKINPNRPNLMGTQEAAIMDNSR